MNEIVTTPPRILSRKVKKRDQQIQRLVTRYADLAHLDDPRYRPALGSLARVSLLLERSYEHLKNRDSLLGENGELCSSIDTVRRLASTHADLLRQLGLMPTSVVPNHADNAMDAVYERISKISKSRKDSEPDAEGE